MKEFGVLKKKNFLTLLVADDSAYQNCFIDSFLELALFLVRYEFILSENKVGNYFLKRDFPPPGELFSQNSNGARYLDPKYSRWISVDPTLGEYVPSAGKSNEADKLPGMGGIFNSVNLSLYHYAGNNPIRYVDPDGNDIDTAFSILYEKYSKTSVGSIRMAIGEFAERKYTMPPDEFRCDNFVQAVLTRAGFNYLDYLSGDATIRNVQNHIENALAKGITSKNKKENAPTLEYGIYIVLMNDSYVIDKNGDPLV